MKTQNNILRFPEASEGEATSEAEVQAPELPKAKPEDKVRGIVQRAKDTVGNALRRLRSMGVNDMQVLGPLETAFENARNALTANAHELQHAEAAVKPLQVAIVKLANHHLLVKTPQVLGETKEELAGFETALNAVKSAIRNPQSAI